MSEWIGKGTKKVIGFEESCKDDVYLTDHYPFVEPEVFISGKFNTGFIEDYYKRIGKEFK